MKSASYLERLRLVFPEVPLPSSGAVIEITIPHDDEIRREIRRVLQGKSWNSLMPEELDPLFGDLILLRHDAFRYYLPAFLQRAVQSKNLLHIELLIDTLDPRLKGGKEESIMDAEWRQAWAENFIKFSETQREAISDFVIWAFTCYEGQELNVAALEYWKGATE